MTTTAEKNRIPSIVGVSRAMIDWNARVPRPGQENTASGTESTVSGGALNEASGNNSSVSGGVDCQETATNAWSVGARTEGQPCLFSN